MFNSVIYLLLATVTSVNPLFGTASFKKSFDDEINKTKILSMARQIKFQCYVNTINDYVTVELVDVQKTMPRNCRLNSGKTLVFYYPGWTQQPSKHDPGIDPLIREFLKRKDVLPIVVNYETLVALQNPTWPNALLTLVNDFQSYLSAVRNADGIALNVANALIGLVKANRMPLKNVRMIGKSLGAQIISRVGANFKRADLLVPRITGLDPAGPLFYPPAQHLTKNDAAFVDIIHTNTIGYGFAYPTGHLDFFPNYPSNIQPGCPTLLGGLWQNDPNNSSYCSHNRAFLYYTESINRPKDFPATNEELKFLLGLTIIDSNTIYMGYDAPTSVHGKFYLHVNPSPQFGKGRKGP